jgi:hypothetical protein
MGKKKHSQLDQEAPETPKAKVNHRKDKRMLLMLMLLLLMRPRER